MSSCEGIRLALGSYAIGGLDAEEAAEVEAHLRRCADCRRAYGQLAPLPELLALVDPDRSAAPAPASRLEDAVLAGFAAQRDAPATTGPRRRTPQWRTGRWRIAVPSAVAGALAAVALLAVTGGLSSRVDEGRIVSLAAAGGGPGSASAQARLAGTEAGTEVELDARLPPLRPGEVYELWFVRRDGRVSAGTFTVGADGRADVRLATAARADAYERMGITREPDGLDPARNGPSVAVGTLAS